MSGTPTKTRWRSLLLVVLGVAISAAAVYVLVQLVDLRATIAVLSQTSPGPLILVAAIVVVELLLRSIRWSNLLPTGDARRVPPVRLLPVLLVGYLGNIILPARLGEAVRAVYVSRREPVALSAAVGSVVLERILDLASLAVVAWLAAVVAGAPNWITVGTGLVASAGMGVAAVLIFVDSNRLADWVERVVGSRSPALMRLTNVLREFGRGAGGQPRRLIGLALLISATCWLLDGTAFFLISVAIGAPVGWTACLLIAAVTVLGTAIPSAPGYVGTFELAAVAAGVALGFPSEPILAMAIVAHALTTGLLGIGGIGVLLTAPLSALIGTRRRPSTRSDRH